MSLSKLFQIDIKIQHMNKYIQKCLEEIENIKKENNKFKEKNILLEKKINILYQENIILKKSDLENLRNNLSTN
jgi:hypothetical protein